jgi:hypothetical protein
MQWYKITISADEASQNIGGKIEDDFKKLFLFTTHRPKIELALFEGGRSSNNETNLYFSPKCAEVLAFKALIDSYKGVLCSEPTRETEVEMGLLIGAVESWKHMMWHPDL